MLRTRVGMQGMWWECGCGECGKSGWKCKKGGEQGWRCRESRWKLKYSRGNDTEKQWKRSFQRVKRSRIYKKFHTFNLVSPLLTLGIFGTISFCFHNWFWAGTRFFLLATLLKATPGWNWQKIKQIISNTLKLNFCYLKSISVRRQRYHSKIIGHILKEQVHLYSGDYTT